MNVTTIILIPGLWLTALSWEHWVKHYSEKGYRVIAANWPGREGDIDQLRRDSITYAALGLTEVVDHYERMIRGFETAPIIIGHGVGGLITQILVDQGWGAAGVAIAPAAPKGLCRTSFWALKDAISALVAPFGDFKAPRLVPEHFHRAFANTLARESSIAAFERYVLPAPRRVVLETSFAYFDPNAPATVKFHNDSRAPLLLVAGGKDRIASSSMVEANFALYRESKAATDYKEYPSRDHFSFLQDIKVADYVLGWALCSANGTKLITPSNQANNWSVEL
jgi:pimeloyl-ACP methyl ester carboxylesterase